LGDTTWIYAGRVTFRDHRFDRLYRSIRWPVAEGQYEVGVTRLTAISGDSSIISATEWHYLKCFQSGEAVALRGKDGNRCVAMMALRFGMGLAGGLSDQINCIVRSILPDLGAWMAQFDGIDGQILGSLQAAFGDAGVYATARTRTFEMYVKTSATSGTLFWVHTGFCVKLLNPATSGGKNIRVELGADSFERTLTGLQSNAWHHIAVSRDGANVKLFYDGVLDYTKAHTGRLANWFRVGASWKSTNPYATSTPGENFFSGNIKHVRIWDIARTAEQITADKDTYLDGDETNLVLYWPMDEGSGEKVYDRSAGVGCGTVNAMGIIIKDKRHGEIDGGVTWVDSGETAAWRWRPTRNPASIYLNALTGNVAKRPRTAGQVDTAAIATWHVRNVTNGFHCDQPVDYETTHGIVLQEIAAAGRASFAVVPPLVSVIEDCEKTIPIVHVTPRNSWDFRWHRNFATIPHGFQVYFRNEDKGYVEDCMLVFQDGYNEDGSGGLIKATEYQRLDIKNETDPDAVWKKARFYLAMRILRPEEFSVNMDLERLRGTRGDLARLQHDVILVGSSYSVRTKSFTVDDDGYILTITFDDAVVMEVAKTYAVRIRDKAGTEHLFAIATDPGQQTTVTLTTPPAGTAAYAAVKRAEDLCMFGETDQESILTLVKSIEPNADHSARITFEPYGGPDIFTSDTSPIPPYNSHVTLPPVVQQQVPRPVVKTVISDESVLLRMSDGTLVTRVRVTFAPLNPTQVPQIEYVQAQYRRSGLDRQAGWTELPQFPLMNGQVFLTGLEEGHLYRIRLRYVSRYGKAGPWAAIFGHYVIGKTSAPPAMQSFRVSETGDGMRIFEWSVRNPPVDLAGILLRYSTSAPQVMIETGLVAESSWNSANRVGQIPVMALFLMVARLTQLVSDKTELQ
ncbi:MAG: hypothetical protein PHQ53_13845, partial [Candidatus Krumholzibacteria bacterium]|nr:hypothetical protein [Candidatus Krumholzibacteria bacterium]